ncbi:MAG: MFS transporter, partial [Bdellovibrionales bacterium]|nr:MFS transporter [Bdellovibrionales bacterium]
VPSSISEGELTFFNSRLRQVDLLTEVLSPVLAGFILAINSSSLIGFYILALWNLLSFFPELALINSVFRERPDLKNKAVRVIDQNKKSIIRKLLEGWKAFFNEPVALVCIANAFLWLSVLSPHGVLLTAFLKDSWSLPEWLIGIVRGSGAIFGLLATVIFPRVVKKFGLRSATFRMVLFQCATLILGLILFIVDSHLITRLGFLALLLLSRIGVYGFGLGETQIRQIEVRPLVRGQVNGFASALTGFATLILYGAGALLPSTSDFKYLVIASVCFICMSSVTYGSWYKRNKKFTGGIN